MSPKMPTLLPVTQMGAKEEDRSVIQKHAFSQGG